jgi:hypothetical protein
LILRSGTVQPPLEAPESVAGMRQVVAGLAAADSGSFLDWTGAQVPW